MLDDGNDQVDLLEWMLVHIKEARGALVKGDIDHFAQAFERVIQHRIKAGIPGFEEALKSKGQSEAGRKKRGTCLLAIYVYLLISMYTCLLYCSPVFSSLFAPTEI